MKELGPYITNPDGTITFPRLKLPGGGSGINQLVGDVLSGPGTGLQVATLNTVNSNVGTWGDGTHVPQITVDGKGRIIAVGNVPISGGGGGVVTSMPIAASLGILDNGSDQTSALNTIFSNAAYAGIIVDFTNPGAITINGTVNCQGKTVRFAPGSYFTGTGRIFNHVHDSGLRQWCYDIGSSGAPALTVDPIGSTLGGWISPEAFGAVGDGVTDDARPFQCTIDCVIRNAGKMTVVKVPSRRYKINSPLICAKYNTLGGSYVFHMGIIEGENTFSSADGSGSQLDFSGRKDSFGIGIHQGKGWTIKNIKFIGGFSYAFPGAYTFYSQSFTAITDGVSRDTAFSPNAAIVIDPFGPSVPADGGYPGNDAYGNALSSYYFGNTNGSTGVELEDIFITNWVIGLITSPNGQTNNAELVTGWKIQISNIKIGFVGCQSQEKLNTIRHVESWGLCGCVFATNLYGAQSMGSWWIDDVNIAGLSNTFIFNTQSGYFPSYFNNIYAESLGRLGTISSNNGTIFTEMTVDFAYYDNGGAFSYLDGMITGQGATFIGSNFRIYGTGHPITITAVNGLLSFQHCTFETVPFYNQDYSLGYCSFQNCTISGSGSILNPLDMQTCSSGNYSGTYAYGNIRVNIGNSFNSTRKYKVESWLPATRMPINTSGASYTVTPGLVGSYFEATITCGADELNRVFVGDVICGETNGSGAGLKILGIVVAAGGGSFTIRYIPSWVTTGSNYRLYVWLPLKNISFTGDTTSGSAAITNVVIADGSLSSFATTNLSTYGGLLKTKSFSQVDAWQSGMVRAVNWNAGTQTLTVDRNSNANKSKLLFTNMDAVPDPGTPTIVAGAAAGSGPTLSITKGNDRSFQVSFTQGSTPITGILATVSFSLPFPGGYVPSISFSPANGNAAALNGASEVFMDAANSNSLIINTGSSALSNGVTYIWNIEAN